VPGGDGTHAARRALEIAVVLVLLAAGLSAWGDLGDRLGVAAPDPFEEPARVEPPGGVELPPPAAPRPVAAGVRGGDLDPAAVRSAVDRLSRGRRLGGRFGLLVAELDGSPVHRQGPSLLTPASTTKLLTAAAVLETAGPEQRFATTVRRAGRTLVLVGGGDPLLQRAPDPDVGYPEERADLRTLAQRVARRLEGPPGRRLQLRYDTSLFAGPAVNPAWRSDYIVDNVISPITALWSDQGRVPGGYGAREDDPARAAAQAFADHLDAAGVRVGRPRPGRAPEASTEVGRVQSAPLGAIVQHVLETSDNEGAEVLLRQVAIASGLPGSSANGVRAGREVLSALGVGLTGARWYDGSGLSRRNRLSLETIVDVLVASLEHPRLAGVTSGLPVAGFTGSLSDRFEVASGPGLGRVRAKTGTLTGVSALAGVLRTSDGTVMLYVALADNVRETHTLWARARLDRISAALAACRCRA
jgi:serine-type D-Ala-D-Ala carboxypeptidase/endopeptidase (penicillin-binding protein 4)